MRIHPDSWYAMTPRWRGLCWAISSAIMVLGLMGGQLRMREQQAAARLTQQVQDTASNAGLWASVRKLSPPDNVHTSEAPRPFSPLAFDTGKQRLVRWLPGSAGGELVIEAVWAQIPTLFVTLAQCDVVVGRFSIQPEQKTLQVTLQLERQHAG